jgi:hypothetical protein
MLVMIVPAIDKAVRLLSIALTGRPDRVTIAARKLR